MTLSFRFSNLFSNLVMGVAVVVSACFSTLASAAAAPRDYSKSDEIELCDSDDMRFRVLRGFSAPQSYFVEYNQDPAVEPDVKEGYTHVQEAGGTVTQTPVSFEMFELMIEPFGEPLKPKSQWKAAFEKVFVGYVTVYDQTGTLLAAFKGQCNSAIVEFN